MLLLCGYTSAHNISLIWLYLGVLKPMCHCSKLHLAQLICTRNMRTFCADYPSMRIIQAYLTLSMAASYVQDNGANYPESAH